jgi:hypothetical protein
MKEFKPAPPFYGATFTSKADCVRGEGYFLRLETLENRARLTSLIVEPCLELLEGNSDAARNLVKQQALEDKDFFSK